MNETSDISYFSHLDDLIFIFNFNYWLLHWKIFNYSWILHNWSYVTFKFSLHGLGIINLSPNFILIIVIQIYLGSNLGLYFKNIKLQEF